MFETLQSALVSWVHANILYFVVKHIYKIVHPLVSGKVDTSDAMTHYESSPPNAKRTESQEEPDNLVFANVVFFRLRAFELSSLPNLYQKKTFIKNN